MAYGFKAAQDVISGAVYTIDYMTTRRSISSAQMNECTGIRLTCVSPGRAPGKGQRCPDLTGSFSVSVVLSWGGWRGGLSTWPTPSSFMKKNRLKAMYQNITRLGFKLCCLVCTSSVSGRPPHVEELLFLSHPAAVWWKICTGREIILRLGPVKAGGWSRCNDLTMAN